ncbi:MAG: class I SAM-dependent methyltransferase [Pseudomonadota bacterium]|nr:class I SAM-dependent methyltransferase [Pseudomonadota bacterium]
MKLNDKAGRYYVIFPRGGEEIVTEILQKNNVKVTETFPTLIFFEAELSQFYQVLLGCPFASRMGALLSFKDGFKKDTESQARLDALDDMLKTIDFPYILPDLKAKVTVKATSGLGIHEQITAKRVSQTITPSYFADDETHEALPHLRVVMTEERIWIGLEASESVLYPRLSPARGHAALKEHLAAVVGAYVDSTDLELVIDPFCGSGTLLLETLANVTTLARPLPRELLIQTWPHHNPKLFQDILDETSVPLTQAQTAIRAVGFDASQTALKAAQMNRDEFRTWGLGSDRLKVHLERRDLCQAWPKAQKGRSWIVMNPPYGKRLGGGSNMVFFYESLGRRLQDYANEVIGAGGQSPGYTIISSDIELLDALRLPYDKQVRLYNGADQIFLRTGTLEAKDIPVRAPLKPHIEDIEKLKEQELFVPDLAQRLVKNYKKMQAFLKKPEPKSGKGLPVDVLEQIGQVNWAAEREQAPLRLFRLYNADLPEYNCAIDVYEHCAYIQEYKAPSKVDPKKAAQRVKQIEFTLATVLGIPAHRILTKSRERQQGKQQYKRFGAPHGKGDKNQPEVRPGHLENWHRFKHVFTMSEWGAHFIVNLGDYIDTGLFLDHRRLRWLVQQISQNKHVLNLFSYTGSLSVHAALGGAASTTSVDLSPRYTSWTEHNFMANGLGLEKNQVVRADVMKWMEGNSNQYDLILIDPPTFSNSKKADDFVIQDHHESLIRQAMRHLQGQGLLFFSCNMKKFELADALKNDFVVDEISHWTQSQDFQTKTGQSLTGGHNSWVIRHKR